MNCKSLKLTAWGVRKLSTVFTPEAIAWADDYMVKYPSKSADTLFNQLWQLCTSYSKTNDLRPNWEALRNLDIPYSAAMEERSDPKRGYTNFSRAPINTSQTQSEGTPPQSSGSQYVTFGGVRCYELCEEEANKRRSEFITNEGVVAGIDNLAKMMGQKPAEKYFERVLYNLKYMPIETQYVHNPRNLPEGYDHST